MGRGLVGTQKRPAGNSHGPEVTSGVQVMRGGAGQAGAVQSSFKQGGAQANRTSLRSHSPGQNNFVQGHANKAVKI